MHQAPNVFWQIVTWKYGSMKLNTSRHQIFQTQWQSEDILRNRNCTTGSVSGLVDTKKSHVWLKNANKTYTFNEMTVMFLARLNKHVFDTLHVADPWQGLDVLMKGRRRRQLITCTSPAPWSPSSRKASIQLRIPGGLFTQVSKRELDFLVVGGMVLKASHYYLVFCPPPFTTPICNPLPPSHIAFFFAPAQNNRHAPFSYSLHGGWITHWLHWRSDNDETDEKKPGHILISEAWG